MCADRTRLGILVGGGPAPGINSAISASTIEAINSGLDVIGIRDGFEHLVKGDTTRVTPLAISDIARVHFQGGSLLGSSRVNPTFDPNDLRRTVKALESLGISYLVTIGGDDTAFSAYEVAKAAGAEGSAPREFAPGFAPTADRSGHIESAHGKMTVVDSVNVPQQPDDISAYDVKRKDSLTTAVNESREWAMTDSNRRHPRCKLLKRGCRNFLPVEIPTQNSPIESVTSS